MAIIWSPVGHHLANVNRMLDKFGPMFGKFGQMLGRLGQNQTDFGKCETNLVNFLAPGSFDTSFVGGANENQNILGKFVIIV